MGNVGLFNAYFIVLGLFLPKTDEKRLKYIYIYIFFFIKINRNVDKGGRGRGGQPTKRC